MRAGRRRVGAAATIDGAPCRTRRSARECSVSRARETRPASGCERGARGRDLFAVAVQLATLSTRRQYAAIYRSFGDWLRDQLSRLPTVVDVDVYADAIAAYARFLETSGGRGGRDVAVLSGALNGCGYWKAVETLRRHGVTDF